MCNLSVMGTSAKYTRPRGALQHLGGDRWRTTIYLGRDRTGRQVRKSRVFTAPNERAAAIAAEAVRTQLRQVADDEQARADTMDGYIDEWLDDCDVRLSPKTVEGYRQICKRIRAEFGRMRVADIRRQDVRRWYTRLLKAGMTPATLDHHHRVLRIILRRAQADELVPSPATFGIDRPPVPKRELDLAPDKKVRSTIGQVSGDLFVAVWLAGMLGLRRGEIMALRWSRLNGRTLTVSHAAIEVTGRGRSEKTTKGRRSRDLDLDDKTMRLLARQRNKQVTEADMLGHHLDKRADRYIVANIEVDPTGETPYSLSWLTHGWAAIRKANGLGMVLHDLRHWCASTLLDSGMNVIDVSEHLGHAQPSTTTNMYGHVKGRADKRRQAAQVMSKAMNG